MQKIKHEIYDLQKLSIMRFSEPLERTHNIVRIADVEFEFRHELLVTESDHGKVQRTMAHIRLRWLLEGAVGTASNSRDRRIGFEPSTDDLNVDQISCKRMIIISKL